MLSSLQVHTNTEQPVATIPSFLFTLVGRLQAEEHALLKPYVFKHLKNENREAYLLSFDIKADADATHFFAREGYTLDEHHLTIDSQYSNQHDWLSLAHGTLIYRNPQDRTAIIVHVYFDKKIALWSVRAKKQCVDDQSMSDERFELDTHQIKAIIGFSQSASLLLQDLLSEYSKRYRDALKKSENIEQELSALSIHLKTKNGRDAYRTKAVAFLESLVALDTYDDSSASKASWSFIERMLALCDQADRLVPIPSIVPPVQTPQVLDPILDVGLEAESAPVSVLVLPTLQQLATEQGQQLYVNMQTLSKKVEALLKESTGAFFQGFAGVDALRLAIAELMFFDAVWETPKNFSKHLKKSEKILAEAQAQRAIKVADLFKNAHFESVQSVLEWLSEKEHLSVIKSIFSYCLSYVYGVDDKKIAQKNLEILDWYFNNKYNLYQSCLKALEHTFFVNEKLLLQGSFLFTIYLRNDFNIFRKFLEHGFNPNGPGIRLGMGNTLFSSLLRGVIFGHKENPDSNQYIVLLMEYGALLDYTPARFSFHQGRKLVLSSSALESADTDTDTDAWSVALNDIKDILRGPSDFLVGCFWDNYGMPQYFTDRVALSWLATGLFHFVNIEGSTLRTMMGPIQASGIECYASKEESNRYLASQPSFPDMHDAYRIKSLLVLDHKIFSFGSRVAESFKKQAQTTEAIDKAIMHLKQISRTQHDLLAIDLWGAIKLLVTQRSALEPLNIDAIKVLIEADFQISENLEGFKKYVYLKNLSTLPGLMPTFQAEILVFSFYKVALFKLGKLEAAMQSHAGPAPAPLLLSAASQSAVAAVAVPPQSLQVPATAVAVVPPPKSSSLPKKSGKKS